MWKEPQLNALLRIGISAGKEILSVYNQAGEIDVTIKDDSSPLTEADRLAHQLIVGELRKLTPDVPILSEESGETPAQERLEWSRFWLVDPLDGTKEFIKRNGEFTVNIALISNGVPELGMVHVPVSGMNYLGQAGTGAWKVNPEGELLEISAPRFSKGQSAVRVVASRNHRGELVDKLIARMESELGDTEVVSMGSSLKICLLAEGKADIYPRLAPTSEWDTAAAHAVLSAAGGEIYDTSFEILRYNQKESMLNPHFIAIADPKFDWASLLLSGLN